MRNLLILCLLLSMGMLVGSCKTASRQKSATQPSQTGDAAHQSNNSLDWDGVYSGTLPCADCEGIQTVVTLNKDLTYQIDTKYVGKEGGAFSLKGKFAWEAGGNKIVLLDIQEGSGPRHYLVGENKLIQLDLKGNRITGELASRYVLNKEVAKSLAPAEAGSKGIPLVGTRWRLVELKGAPVAKNPESKENSYLQLDQEGRFSAFAGCNRMFGGYEAKEAILRINFKGVASTMMACPDMKSEQILAEVLKTVDNYSLSGQRMTLNKARMAPLAVFEAE
jgi:copper homeostasis protein (lipoprotein)